MMWGGSDEPCALCQLASLGSINGKNNKVIISIGQAYYHLILAVNRLSARKFATFCKRNLLEFVQTGYVLQMSCRECDVLEMTLTLIMKVYIEFRDVPRENMGYDGSTF